MPAGGPMALFAGRTSLELAASWSSRDAGQPLETSLETLETSLEVAALPPDCPEHYDELEIE